MQIRFYKYQGAGNDFILIDNRDKKIKLKPDQIKFLCDRHFGIGADGLMLLETHPDKDFSMVYYNSDGKIGTMCGNGGRCIVKFMHDLGGIEKHTVFQAADGEHKANIKGAMVQLYMQNVDHIKKEETYYFLDTGSPHHVIMVENVDKIDVKNTGATIRYGKLYGKKGANVNFVQKIDDQTIFVRTYERGVEDETLACGTGVTAAAIVAYKEGLVKNTHVKIKTLGGNLTVDFKESPTGVRDVILAGSAVSVFNGEITL